MTKNDDDSNAHHDNFIVNYQHQQRPTLTIFPLASRRVDDSEQLVVGHGFRVKVNGHRFLLHDLVGLEQRLPDHALAGASVTDDEDGVTDVEQFLKLHHLRRTTKRFETLSTAS